MFVRSIDIPPIVPSEIGEILASSHSVSLAEEAGVGKKITIVRTTAAIFLMIVRDGRVIERLRNIVRLRMHLLPCLHHFL